MSMQYHGKSFTTATKNIYGYTHKESKPLIAVLIKALCIQ